jgi:hypothetical protein
MAENDKNVAIGRLTREANDGRRSPASRIMTLRRLLRKSNFSVRSVALAKRLTKQFLEDKSTAPQARKASLSLLDKIYAGRDDDESDDDVEEVLNGDHDPSPHGTPAVAKKCPSYGFKTFEQVIPYIEGLACFDFNHPRGLEVVPGRQWMNFQERLMESISEVYIPHDLYEDIGGAWEANRRDTWTTDEMKNAIVRFADRNTDPSKPAPQYLLTDWKIVQVTEVPVVALESPTTAAPIAQAPVPGRDRDNFTGWRPEMSVPPAIMPGQSLPPTRATCRICGTLPPGMSPPAHSCSSFQF